MRAALGPYDRMIRSLPQSGPVQINSGCSVDERYPDCLPIIGSGHEVGTGIVRQLHRHAFVSRFLADQRQRVAEIMSQYRAFGAGMWRERDRLLQRLICAAEVCQSNGENPRDAELYGELLALGAKYGVHY